jgi:hypothetical protein
MLEWLAARVPDVPRMPQVLQVPLEQALTRKRGQLAACMVEAK